jgi:DNA-binding NarL/FixJ family response regulator
VVADLLIEVRIQAAAQLQGASVATASSAEAPALIRESRPALIIADLAVTDDLDALVAASREASATLIAYYPHVDSELRRAAQNAGIEYVYPRSRFLRDLPKVLGARLQP